MPSPSPGGGRPGPRTRREAGPSGQAGRGRSRQVRVRSRRLLGRAPVRSLRPLPGVEAVADAPDGGDQAGPGRIGPARLAPPQRCRASAGPHRTEYGLGTHATSSSATSAPSTSLKTWPPTRTLRLCPSRRGTGTSGPPLTSNASRTAAVEDGRGRAWTGRAWTGRARTGQGGARIGHPGIPPTPRAARVPVSRKGVSSTVDTSEPAMTY